MSTPDVGMAFCSGIRYPDPPYNPPELYPELKNSFLHIREADPENHVYPLVREALFRHFDGYDPKTKTVKPSTLHRLGKVRKIVVKPNWVLQQNEPTDCVTTHASVLRPLLDYLLLAFGETAQIIVADIPLQSADIHQIWAETGIIALRDYYASRATPVSFMDFRREKAIMDSSGFILRRESLRGDPLGYVEVSLDKESYLEEISNGTSVFSVDDYEPGMAACYHRPGCHRYLIPRTVLAADLFVNVPKLKTHCKAGLTACMKNLIGINGQKGWIPHHRMGAPREGGDEYRDRDRFIMNLKSRMRNTLQEHNQWMFRLGASLWKNYKRGWETFAGAHLTTGGAWPGNDTLWRSILDLVRVITCADQSGVLMEKPQRRHLCVIDAIICGEGEGPLCPSPKKVGAILCSSNPVIADWAACHIAGFDWRKIPQLFQARTLHRILQDFHVNPDSLTVSWAEAEPGMSLMQLPSFHFRPPTQWMGHIEISPMHSTSGVKACKA